MRNSMYIGECPVEEPCVFVTNKQDYVVAMRFEVSVFRDQLIRTLGELQEGCFFKITSNQHDFGTYYSLEFLYDDESQKAIKYGLRAERGLKNWDDESKARLQTSRAWMVFWVNAEPEQRPTWLTI